MTIKDFEVKIEKKIKGVEDKLQSLREELFEYVNSLDAHRMSPATRKALANHESRLQTVEDLMKRNTEFHERLEPILQELQNSAIARQTLTSWISWLAKVIAGITIIFGGIGAMITLLIKIYI